MCSYKRLRNLLRDSWGNEYDALFGSADLLRQGNRGDRLEHVHAAHDIELTVRDQAEGGYYHSS